MQRSLFQNTFGAAACLTLLASCGSEAPAEGEAAAPAGDEPAVIGERQDNFEGIGDAFKLIRGQLEGGSPDFALIASEAGTIKANAEKIAGHFPEGTGVDAGYDTEALATIWEKPDEFTAAHQKLIEASDGLIAAAQSEDAAAVQAQVGEVGMSCKGCHDQFRLDDD
ncbi:MAG: cytochrome c [Pseudomonadota bacterium]